jgi:hypothetical protein
MPNYYCQRSTCVSTTGPGPSVGYSCDVIQAANLRSCIVGWLLCFMVTVFALFPATCPACDGTLLTQQLISSTHTVAPVHIASPDGCNGACSCCLFQGLPLQFVAEFRHESVSTKRVV